ncbi:MAG: HAMP domain-containing histidine kinase [Bacteroidales bacterium]|nr:HAMP domain-containing histidine kinase [Bacteroidales bacterium]
MLLIISPRKSLHVAYIVSFVSLGFIFGFAPHYGIWRDLWPYDVVKNLLFIAINFFVMGVNYAFVVMPKFRKVNRWILLMLSSVVLLVCLMYWVTPDEFNDVIIAIISGVQIIYLSYAMFHLVKSININIKYTFVIPIYFVLYLAFIVWTAVHALQNRQEIFTHFFVGAIFPTALSFIGGYRQHTIFMKARDPKIGLSPEVSNRMEELEYANTSKDKFFSIIAHDLKSPIGSIKTISEIYSDEAAQSKDPHASELATALRDSIDGLCALLDDLLSWSRSQSGAMQFIPSYIDIETLMDNVKQVVKPVCNAKNIHLKMSIKERDKLYGDTKMLKTILRNLINNAVKYSYSDSVISVDFDAEGMYSIIKVSDNGIGMNKSDLNDLFQLDKLTSRPGTNREDGNGLGLIVCHDFVEKHGGTISVETEENLGTTFVVKIPYARYINKNA